jgi:hypothetical protein
LSVWGGSRPDGEPAKDKGPGSERNILVTVISPAPDNFDFFCLFDRAGRSGRTEKGVPEEFKGTRPRMFQHCCAPGPFVTLRAECRVDECRADLIDIGLRVAARY